MIKVEGLLFDCDGVVLDTDTPYRLLVSDALTNTYNYPITHEDAIKRWKGYNAVQIGQELTLEGHDFGDVFANDLIEQSKTFRVNKDVIVPNILDVLEYAKDIPKAVCSNGRTERLVNNFEDAGLTEHFEFINGRDKIGLMKPHPDFYKIGAEKLCVDIENCIVVEDSTHGLEAAVLSGGISVGFTGTGSNYDDLKKINPDYIISDMNQLIDIIKKHQ